MPPDRIFHFKGRDLFTRAVDELLESADQVEIPILIYPSLISTPHKAICKGLRIGILVHVRSHFIALHDAGTLDANLTFLAHTHALITGPGFHNSQLWPNGRAHGLQLPHSISGIGAERICLCHGIGRQNCGLKEVFHLLSQARQQCRTVVADDFQRTLEVLCFLGQSHQGHVVCRHGGVAGGQGLLFHGFKEGVSLILPRQGDEFAAAIRRHQKVLHYSSDVKHGHGVHEDILRTQEVGRRMAQSADGHAFMRDGHDLGFLGGPGGVKHQAYVFTLHGFQRRTQLGAAQRLPCWVLLEEKEPSNFR
mmetsp:Transcript_23829/g.51826  ORF Transcript_23829/g.51826 Transcript_23829/m.51826 type:complete len:307 (+) Transcript_23829:343-1263(+)